MTWKEITEHPPFGDWIKKENRLLLLEGGASQKLIFGNCKVGYLGSIDKSGMHFVNDFGEDLDEPGGMAVGPGHKFEPTHWCLIELP